MKYNSIEKLKKAYDSGELSQKDMLIIDNDRITAYVEKEDKYLLIYEGGLPRDVLGECLALLGIPYDYA